MSSPYSVVPADAAAAAATMLRLWSNSFEQLQGEQAERKLDHFYLRNPAGSGPVFLLRDNQSDADVGIQTLVLRRFFANGTAHVAGTLADYAVDPAHRSLGPALQLMKASIAGSKSTLAFLYGLPNRKAEPILRRAGLAPILEMARYAAPLRSRHYLEEKVPALLLGLGAAAADIALALADRWRAARSAHAIGWDGDKVADSDIDTIWAAAARSGCMLSERSADVLRWRYKTGANGGVWRIDVARERRTKQPVGYVVWTLRDGVAVVGDFLCAEPARGTADLLAAFRCRARALGAVSISLEYCGSPAIASALLAAGLVLRESNPVYAVINQTLPAAECWYLTGFDRDTD